jgi:hypothetical protein
MNALIFKTSGLCTLSYAEEGLKRGVLGHEACEQSRKIIVREKNFRVGIIIGCPAELS